MLDSPSSSPHFLAVSHLPCCIWISPSAQPHQSRPICSLPSPKLYSLPSPAQMCSAEFLHSPFVSLATSTLAISTLTTSTLATSTLATSTLTRDTSAQSRKAQGGIPSSGLGFAVRALPLVPCRRCRLRRARRTWTMAALVQGALFHSMPSAIPLRAKRCATPHHAMMPPSIVCHSMMLYAIPHHAMMLYATR